MYIFKNKSITKHNKFNLSATFRKPQWRGVPYHAMIYRALTAYEYTCYGYRFIISNPDWTRRVMKPLYYRQVHFIGTKFTVLKITFFYKPAKIIK